MSDRVNRIVSAAVAVFGFVCLHGVAQGWLLTAGPGEPWLSILVLLSSVFLFAVGLRRALGSDGRALGTVAVLFSIVVADGVLTGWLLPAEVGRPWLPRLLFVADASLYVLGLYVLLGSQGRTLGALGVTFGGATLHGVLGGWLLTTGIGEPWLSVLVLCCGLFLFVLGLHRLLRTADRAAVAAQRYVTLALVALVLFFPFFWMVMTSLKPRTETKKSIIPRAVRSANYGHAMAFEHGNTDILLEADPKWVRAMGSPWVAARQWAGNAALFFKTPFFQQLCNTLTVGVLGTLGVVISSSLAAYAFARLKWPGRDFFFLLTITTMMVPFAVKLVPLYGLFKWIGWKGTLKPLWAPAFFGTGFSIFLLRQFFKGIPRDLTDAARIDGCSEFAIYWRIILPLAKPALAAVALFHFLYVWNDFFAPLVFLTDPSDFTLALGLHQFQSTHGGATPWTWMMAAATLVTLPVIVLFFFTQRFFVRGVTMSGIKG